MSLRSESKGKRARARAGAGAGAQAVDGSGGDEEKALTGSRHMGERKTQVSCADVCRTEECGCLPGLLVICCPVVKGRTRRRRQAGDRGLRAEDEQAMWALWL